MMDELLEDMVDPPPPPEDAARRRRLWATGSVLVLAGVGVASLTTAAVFTDQAESADRITTGTVDLTVGKATLPVPTTGLAPGDHVLTPVTVTNAGSLALRYSVSLSAATAAPAADRPTGGGDVRTQLRVRVLGTSACGPGDPADAADPTGVPVLGDTGGTAGAFGLPAELTNLVGDRTGGAHTGDRTLAGAGVSETLCLRVDMSRDADDTFQNTAADLRLQFDAEQTANNP